jgi:hypothetical protein
MRVYLRSARRFHGRLLDDVDEAAFVYNSNYRCAEIAEWRRRQRKIAVFKAIVASVLLFLICGSAVLIGYAISG